MIAFILQTIGALVVFVVGGAIFWVVLLNARDAITRRRRRDLELPSDGEIHHLDGPLTRVMAPHAVSALARILNYSRAISVSRDWE